MRKNCMILLALLNSFALLSQESASSIISFAKEDINGIGLPKIVDPNNPDRVLFQKKLYRGEELSLYMISIEYAVNDHEHFPIEEFILWKNGKALIEPREGEDYEFKAGDFIVASKGYQGSWTIVPGNEHHLELSVISTERASAASTSLTDRPFRIDEDMLSGLKLEPKDSQIVREVHRGVELNIDLVAQRPKTSPIEVEKETLYYVLSGAVSISLGEGQQVFYPDEFFVLPSGFTGNWESKSYDLVQYFRVTSAL